MIISFVLYLIYGVVYIITSPLRAFSDVATPGIVSTTIASVSGYLASAYHWLPLTVIALLGTWGAFVVVEGFIFLYKGFMWVLKKIPGIN